MAINAETKTIDVTFSNYTAGTQYAKNEAHVINESLTIYTTECHFTTELRIYSSDSNNGYAVSNELPGAITQMTFNAGHKKDVLNVYGSTDGSSWKLVEGISITSTSYKDYSLDFPTNSSYTYFKLDVEGNQQIRIKKMSVTYTTSTGGGEEPGEGGGEEPGDDPVVPEIPETATVVTFDFTDPSSLKPVQETPEFGQDKSITVNDVVFTAGNVSLSFVKGTASTDCRIWAGKSAYDLRTYKNSTMTFTVTGAAITSIVFTGSEVGSSSMTSEEGTFEGKTWKGDSQSITFTAKATTKINTITVTYDTATGIEDTMVDENAPVEYYNLQGVKVANPENGIFIKKQGGRTSKVVL